MDVHLENDAQSVLRDALLNNSGSDQFFSSYPAICLSWSGVLVVMPAGGQGPVMFRLSVLCLLEASVS